MELYLKSTLEELKAKHPIRLSTMGFRVTSSSISGTQTISFNTAGTGLYTISSYPSSIWAVPMKSDPYFLVDEWPTDALAAVNSL